MYATLKNKCHIFCPYSNFSSDGFFISREIVHIIKMLCSIVTIYKKNLVDFKFTISIYATKKISCQSFQVHDNCENIL